MSFWISSQRNETEPLDVPHPRFVVDTQEVNVDPRFGCDMNEKSKKGKGWNERSHVHESVVTSFVSMGTLLPFSRARVWDPLYR